MEVSSPPRHLYSYLNTPPGPNPPGDGPPTTFPASRALSPWLTLPDGHTNSPAVMNIPRTEDLKKDTPPGEALLKKSCTVSPPAVVLLKGTPLHALKM